MMQWNPKKIIGKIGRKYGGAFYKKAHARCFAFLHHLNISRQTLPLFFGLPSADPLFKRLDRELYSDLSSVRAEDYPEGVIVILDGSFTHGGLTDRLRGILSVYEECKRRHLPFFISWTRPFPLERYLLPANPERLDWRIGSKNVARDRRSAKMVVADDLTDVENRFRLRGAFLFPKRQLHIYTNADTSRGRYQQLFNELFLPSPILRESIDRHLSRMTPGYHAFAFRFMTLLNDFTDCQLPQLSAQEQEELMVKVERELNILIEDVPQDKSIFITGDSLRFLNRVRDLDPRIYIVEGDIRHIDRDQEIPEDVELKTFTDQFLLMNAARVTLLRTGMMYNSGFSRFAAEVGGAEFINHLF
ncbi:MAG: hypothetical protein K2M45_08695 [Muribaculaceae bacterium]|nr:hypothetical protein [Muribaculaceae bacterium]